VSVFASARRLAFVLPGDLDGLTGGTIYDRQIVAGLRHMGWQVDVVSLSTRFPWPDAGALDEAASAVAGVPDDTLVVADGLAFGAMPAIAQQHASRLRWVALVHHPLALETGLSDLQRRQLFESERQALAAARAVIVTSTASARALADFGMAATRIRAVEPGTTPAALALGSEGNAHDESCSLLCVATLTPRKGHAVLLDALAGLQDRRWTLHCVGSTTRDAASASGLRAVIAARGLSQRVFLHGELGADALEAMYTRADAFVLPSFYEGYGMALAEALAHGLPIVSTTAGAIPDTVPAGAGVLVPPGDAAALRAALARLLDEPVWRATLAAGARAARTRLPGWPTAVERFAAVLTEFERETAAGGPP
jgi:glycosyltransferase involved in cell wall biosynthesis